jgi:hypothetical protein
MRTRSVAALIIAAHGNAVQPKSRVKTAIHDRRAAAPRSLIVLAGTPPCNYDNTL